jgi:DNA-binding transcriptional LysR family regulator
LNGLVPCSIRALRRDFPKLRIRVVPGLSADLLPQVERGALDAAIISGPETALSHLNWRPFAAEPLVVLAALDAPSDEPIHLLENYPYIRFTRRAWVGMMIDRWLREMNVKVDDCMELETLESISSMVMYNQGVSIVPQSCLPPAEPLKLKRIPLGPTINPRILGVISRGDSVKFRLIDALVAELTDAVESAGQVRVIRPREGRSQEQSS